MGENPYDVPTPTSDATTEILRSVVHWLSCMHISAVPKFQSDAWMAYIHSQISNRETPPKQIRPNSGLKHPARPSSNSRHAMRRSYLQPSRFLSCDSHKPCEIVFTRAINKSSTVCSVYRMRNLWSTKDTSSSSILGSDSLLTSTSSLEETQGLSSFRSVWSSAYTGQKSFTICIAGILSKLYSESIS